MAEIELVTLLGGGADVVTFGLVAFLWRMDRRLVRLEALIEKGNCK